MQFTDLNRTINLILVGTITIVAGAFIFFNQIQAYFQPPIEHLLQPYTPEQIISAVPATLLALTVPFIALSMFFGIVVEGLSEILIRGKMLKYISKSKPIRKFLAFDRSYELNLKLQKQFANLLLNSNKYSVKETMDEEEIKSFATNDEKVRPYAAAIFQKTAQPEHLKFILNHYSIHVLAADFALIVLVLITVVPLLDYVGHYVGFNINVISFPWSIMVAFLLYPLTYITADQERYTYEASFRQGILVLSERPEAREDKPVKQLAAIPGDTTITPTPTPDKVTSKSKKIDAAATQHQE